MEAWTVWVVAVLAILLVWVAFLAGRRQGRALLEDRVLRRALSTKVRDVMTRPVVFVRQGTPAEEAARIMYERNVGCLPVLDAQGRWRVSQPSLTSRDPGTSPFAVLRGPRLKGEDRRCGGSLRRDPFPTHRGGHDAAGHCRPRGRADIGRRRQDDRSRPAPYPGDKGQRSAGSGVAARLVGPLRPAKPVTGGQHSLMDSVFAEPLCFGLQRKARICITG